MLLKTSSTCLMRTVTATLTFQRWSRGWLRALATWLRRKPLVRPHLCTAVSHSTFITFRIHPSFQLSPHFHLPSVYIRTSVCTSYSPFCCAFILLHWFSLSWLVFTVCFKLFDRDSDGRISWAEFVDAITCCLSVQEENKSSNEPRDSPEVDTTFGACLYSDRAVCCCV